MNMSSFLCFYFHKNLQELNEVRTEMNGEKDEFLFLESQREESLFFRFLRDGWLTLAAKK